VKKRWKEYFKNFTSLDHVWSSFCEKDLGKITIKVKVLLEAMERCSGGMVWRWFAL